MISYSAMALLMREMIRIYPPDYQAANNLMDRRSEAPRKFPLTTKSTFEPLRNPSNRMQHDVTINDPADEPVMLENDPNQKQMEIKFTFRQAFSSKGHFDDVLNEFVIVKKFELEHING